MENIFSSWRKKSSKFSKFRKSRKSRFFLKFWKKLNILTFWKFLEFWDFWKFRKFLRFRKFRKFLRFSKILKFCDRFFFQPKTFRFFLMLRRGGRVMITQICCSGGGTVDYEMVTSRGVNAFYKWLWGYKDGKRLRMIIGWGGRLWMMITHGGWGMITNDFLHTWMLLGIHWSWLCIDSKVWNSSCWEAEIRNWVPEYTKNFACGNK